MTIKMYKVQMRTRSDLGIEQLEQFIDAIRKNCIIVFSKQSTDDSLTLATEMCYQGELTHGAQAQVSLYTRRSLSSKNIFS